CLCGSTPERGGRQGVDGCGPPDGGADRTGRDLATGHRGRGDRPSRGGGRRGLAAAPGPGRGSRPGPGAVAGTAEHTKSPTRRSAPGEDTVSPVLAWGFLVPVAGC